MFRTNNTNYNLRDNIQPSFKTLEKHEETTKDDLRRILVESSSLDLEDGNISPETIRAQIVRIKESRTKYVGASKALSKWYSDIGSFTRGNEIRSDRLNLVYDEAAGCVKILNEALSKLDQDIESSIVMSEASTADPSRKPAYSHPIGAEGGTIPKNKADAAESTKNASIILNLSSSKNPDIETTENFAKNLSTNEKREINNVQNDFKFDQFLQLDSRPDDAYAFRRTEGNFTAPPHVPSHHTPVPSDPDRLDPLSRRMLKLDLRNGVGDKYDGSPEKFWAWYHDINSRIIECEANSTETIFILKANTTKKPRELINMYLSAGLTNPSRILSEIWEDFKKKFGSNTKVTTHLVSQMKEFPKIRHPHQTEEMEKLMTLCKVIQLNMDRCPDLQLFGTGHGMREVWEKLPETFISRWRRESTSAERRNGHQPSFKDLLLQISHFIDENTNPNFTNVSRNIRSCATEVTTDSSAITCAFHNSPGHSILECKAFKNLEFPQRKQHAIENRLCFRCLGNHRSNQCRQNPVCSICRRNHVDVMHFDYNNPDNVNQNSNHSFSSARSPNDMNNGNNRRRGNQTDRPQENIQRRGNQTDRPPENNQRRGNQTDRTFENSERRGDTTNNDTSNTNNHSLCSAVCGSVTSKKVCSKTVPVELRVKGERNSIKGLCIIDEQSNRTFVDEHALGALKVPSSNVQPHEYKIATLSRIESSITGVIIDGLEVRGIRKNSWISLPSSLSHPSLPDTREETSSPETVRAHPHLAQYAHNFPKIDPHLEVILLIGTNCGDAMKTRCYGSKYPYAHDTALGWALVGPSCLSSPNSTRPRAMMSYVDTKCDHLFATDQINIPKTPNIPQKNDIFIEKPDDELPGPSQEDQEFLHIVSSGIRVNAAGNLKLPIPFKEDKVLPDNKTAVYARTSNTLSRIARDPLRAQQCVESMQKYLDKGHVEELPSDQSNSPLTYYIPILTVYNEKKRNIRIVFDSSAKYNGLSLNDCLLQGPDLTNRIIGVLVRFRQRSIAFAGDIECMFHAFFVSEEHRDALRFFWWSCNDPSKKLAVYRAKVHIFGNKSSPAIAAFGLRYITSLSEVEKPAEAVDFINNGFYIDDGFASEDSVAQAIQTLESTRELLKKFNIRFHKLISNNKEVLEAFPTSELSSNLESLELKHSPTQHALGTIWNIATDELQLRVNIPTRNYTKRGVLSVNGSLYDPLGIASPVSLTGRLLQRKLFPRKGESDSIPMLDWDDPLPSDLRDIWDNWVADLQEADIIKTPRCYHPPDFSQVATTELHVFADASDEAIGHAIFIRETDIVGKRAVALLFGNSKVSPRSATSIPRLELCAALDAVKSAQYIISELRRTIHKVVYYSDSGVVLAYLKNTERRFSRYVTSRVAAILRFTSVHQWQYIPSAENIADIATRPHSPRQLIQTNWLSGPPFLLEVESLSTTSPQEPTSLPEERPEVHALQTEVPAQNPILDCITKRTNSWKRIVTITTTVIRFIERLRKKNPSILEARHKAIVFITSAVQYDAFPEVFRQLKSTTKSTLSKGDKLSSLAPFLDDDGIIRVGGRLQNSDLPYAEKHPALLPPSHAVTNSIMLHYHGASSHQGRHVTTASIRQAGWHILHQRNAIGQMLKNCVFCQRIRGRLQEQKMADLPVERLGKTPPFAHSGLDVFGPYYVSAGQATRKTKSTKKIWVLLCTCLYSRAVHMETISSLDTSTLKLALRRFLALRNNCRRILSDQGSNFLGARNQAKEHLDLEALRKEVTSDLITWDLIPPKASHFAGVWERKIASVKNSLNNAILQLKERVLTKEEFDTLVQEAASMVNRTPLHEISCDPNDPFPVSPAALLNLSEDPPANDPSIFTNADLLAYGKARWRRVQYLADQFWSRWKRDYLHQLQTRNKWMYPSTNLKEGDIVLLRQPSPRSQWPMGRIVKCHPSKDGLVRSALVSLKPLREGVPRFLERCVHDMVLLIPS